MLFIRSKDFMCWTLLTCWWAVIRKLPNSWSEPFGIFWIMPRPEALIPWDCGFMDVSLVKPKDISTSGFTLRAEAPGKKEIIAESKLFCMKKKKISSWRKSLKVNAHPASPTLSEEYCSKDKTQIIHLWPDTLIWQLLKVDSKLTNSWREKSM